jgi:Tfp pilus assembly protein PilE
VGPRDREGFTPVELAVAALIINILAALVMPNVRMVLLKARAVDVVADLRVLRVGVFSYWAENNQ